jgi:tRNA1Val (adenine37-N6)-methyltransferase
MEERKESPGETVDDILWGKLKLVQGKEGYRFSVDPLVLADFIKVKAKDRVIDLGTGNGIIPLLLAAKKRPGYILGVEIQPRLSSLARRNVILNKMEDRVEIKTGDFRQLDLGERFSVVVSNPPYLRSGAGRTSPEPERAIARSDLYCTLPELIAAAGRFIARDGRFYLIFPAKRLFELLMELKGYGFAPVRMRLVYSKPKQPAGLVLIDARKRPRPELSILPPLIIYNEDGIYTKEMNRIFSP